MITGSAVPVAQRMTGARESADWESVRTNCQPPNYHARV